MKRSMILVALVLAGAAGTVAGAKSTQTDPNALPSNACFRLDDIQSSVQVSETQLNILTRDRHYIRVDTAGHCFYPPFTDAYVVRSHGPDLVCSPIDLDLSAGPPGFKTPCIVQKLTLLTPTQAAALPKGQKP